MIHRLILENGERISSGPGTSRAIFTLELTRCVNSGSELTPGSVCSGVMEAEVLWDDSTLPAPGEKLHLQGKQGEAWEDLGVFLLEKPQYVGNHRWKFTAYDPVSLLDREVGPYLEALPGWPYEMRTLVELVCMYCGVSLKKDTLEMGDLLVDKIPVSSVTGRQILKWAGETACQFCRADPQGVLEFSWYTQKDMTLSPGGTSHYFQRGLTIQDYTTAKTEKVVIRGSQSDVGTVYPDQEQAAEVYTLTGNMLLHNLSKTELSSVAEHIYGKLREVCYTPCTVEIPQGLGVLPGDRIRVEDTQGKTHSVYVMEICSRNHRDTITCTGSSSRGTSTAVNNLALTGTYGRVMELTTEVEGLRAENRNREGEFARLELAVEGMEATVSQQEAWQEGTVQRLTALEQTGENLSLQVRQIQQSGTTRVETQTGYTFDETGLRIRKSGQEMENLLDNTGMYVLQSGETVLRANDQGVYARDISVCNYLILGTHARLEDYDSGQEERTACFYLR